MADTYAIREQYRCDVCSNVPDEDGMIEHGRGCFVVDEEGGGQSWVCSCEYDNPRPDCEFHKELKKALEN